MNARQRTITIAALALAAACAHAETIRFGVGVDPAFAPIYLAAQQKMFAKAGLDVEVQIYTQGGDSVDAVVAGTNQIGVGSESTLITRFGRGNLTGIGITGQSGKYIKLAVRKEITDPRQLKKIGIVPGSSSEFSAGKMVAKYGMDDKAITWVKGAPPEYPALLARGDVDGYFLWEPWPSRGEQVGGKILLTSGDVGYTYNMVVGVSDKWFAANKAQAKAVMDTLKAACDVIRADPDKGAQASQAMAKIPAAQAKDLMKDVDCVVRDFTPADLQAYREVSEFLYSRKSTPAVTDVPKYLQMGFVSGTGK